VIVREFFQGAGEQGEVSVDVCKLSSVQNLLNQCSLGGEDKKEEVFQGHLEGLCRCRLLLVGCDVVRIV